MRRMLAVTALLAFALTGCTGGAGEGPSTEEYTFADRATAAAEWPDDAGIPSWLPADSTGLELRTRGDAFATFRFTSATGVALAVCRADPAPDVTVVTDDWASTAPETVWVCGNWNVTASDGFWIAWRP